MLKYCENCVKTEDGRARDTAVVALVRSEERCGLGPVIATNAEIGTVNFIWEMARKSTVLDVTFYRDKHRYEDYGNFVIQSETVVPQERL